MGQAWVGHTWVGPQHGGEQRHLGQDTGQMNGGREPRPWGFRGAAGFDNHIRKLKMPICDGTEAHDWVFRAERYFAVNDLTEAEQLMAVGLCMEGRALTWFRWREERQPLRSWGEFKAGLLERFRLVQDGSLSEQFFGITQTGSVMDYRDRFELLSSQMQGFSDADLTANFLKGLKPDLKAAGEH